jgi:hypothetical protein
MLIGASVLILIVIAAIRETAFEDEAGPVPAGARMRPGGLTLGDAHPSGAGERQ